MGRLFLSLILLLFPALMRAQPPAIEQQTALQKAGVKDVRALFRDSRGFVWIGTEYGLYRFDGSNTDGLRHSAGNPSSLPNNTVISIAEDAAGDIWAGCIHGICKINAYTLQCTAYDVPAHNLEENFDNKVFPGSDGEVWAGNQKGLYRLDARQNRFMPVWKTNDVKHREYYVTAFLNWGRDSIAVGTMQGVAIINKRNYGSRRLPFAGSNMLVTQLCRYRQTLIIGTWGGGCFIGDENGLALQVVKLDHAQQGEIPDIVNDITPIPGSNTVLAATGMGLYKLTVKQGILTDTAYAGSLLQKHIQRITAGKNGYIWLGGQAVWLLRGGRSFITGTPYVADGVIMGIQPLQSGNTHSLAISSWYGSAGLQVRDSSLQHILYKPASSSTGDYNNVSGIERDRLGRLWVSALDGLHLLDAHFKSIGPAWPPGKTAGIAINHDTVWAAHYNTGIDLYDLALHKIISFTDRDGCGLKDRIFNELYADSKGRIWICGGSYFYQYLPQQKKFRLYNFSGDAAGLSPWSVTEMKGGDLLIASEAGLFRFNPNTAAYKKITAPLLAEDKVQSAIADKFGNVWYLSGTQLACYSPAQNHFTLYGTEDGLPANDEPQLLATIDSVHFYIAQKNKIFTFSAGESGGVQDTPLLYIRSLQVNDSNWQSFAGAQVLHLLHSQNKLLIAFGLINQAKPEQNVYAYRLTGVDDTWVTGHANTAAYANLAPGTYTFEARAATYAGAWSKPYSIKIVITPAFWQTAWFNIIALAALVALVFVIARYITRRNLKERILVLEKEQALQQERNRIARDIHDDLGSGLTKIAILSEVAKTRVGDTAFATANLGLISSASRELVDNLQDIVWVLNPRNDSLESLCLYIKKFAEGFFENTPVKLAVAFPPVMPAGTLTEEKRRSLFLAVKESCNNALKHASCGNVRILINKEDVLTIMVADDGNGFNKDGVSRFANGLQNMQARMAQAGGGYQITSIIGKGTEVMITMPL